MLTVNVHLTDDEVETMQRESYLDKEITVECDQCGESHTIEVRLWANS
jgi:hypothetical protein